MFLINKKTKEIETVFKRSKITAIQGEQFIATPSQQSYIRFSPSVKVIEKEANPRITNESIQVTSQ